MDISAFVPDDRAFGARTHLPEIGVWIPTAMPIFPLYLKSVRVFLEEFRTFFYHEYVKNS